jgi:hypothetical protein
MQAAASLNLARNEREALEVKLFASNGALTQNLAPVSVRRLPLCFDVRFAVLTLVLLLLEIGIERFVHDRFVRPFVGDVLVVILIFAACRSFVLADERKLACAVLLFAFAIEAAQYFQLVHALGLQGNVLARTVIGITFDVRDLLAYTLGIALVLARGTGQWEVGSSSLGPTSAPERGPLAGPDGELDGALDGRNGWQRQGAGPKLPPGSDGQLDLAGRTDSGEPGLRVHQRAGATRQLLTALQIFLATQVNSNWQCSIFAAKGLEYFLHHAHEPDSKARTRPLIAHTNDI